MVYIYKILFNRSDEACIFSNEDEGIKMKCRVALLLRAAAAAAERAITICHVYVATDYIIFLAYLYI